jgi:hypothetical protein
VSLKLYTELAMWWPLLSPPDDYLDEANFFHQVLVAAGLPPASTLLELGCGGGGNNAVHLKAHLARVTLTNLSSHMLAVSRALNPDCEHLVRDMRTLRLGRAFDVVFIHDAIDYMTRPGRGPVTGLQLAYEGRVECGAPLSLTSETWPRVVDDVPARYHKEDS